VGLTAVLLITLGGALLAAGAAVGGVIYFRSRDAVPTGKDRSPASTIGTRATSVAGPRPSAPARLATAEPSPRRDQHGSPRPNAGRRARRPVVVDRSR